MESEFGTGVVKRERQGTGVVHVEIKRENEWHLCNFKCKWNLRRED